MIKQYLLFLLQCINMMGKYLFKDLTRCFILHLDQPCLSWVDNCLACLNLWDGFMLVMIMQLSSVLEYVNVKTRSSMVLNGTLRTTQDNSTTTVHMALA
jgi:hypothetical protein